MRLVLRAVDVSGPCRWRWTLVDERSGVLLADHAVKLDPRAADTAAFDDLYRFLRRWADPERRVAAEAELVRRVGAWIGSVVLGERIGRAIATAAPVTVRMVVPAGAEFLAYRPLELAHIGGVPLAAQGHVALVYDLPGQPRSTKAPIGESLRMLGVFSLPTATRTSGIRRERYELSRLVRRVATRSRRQVQLEVAPYAVTRAAMAELAASGDGWDVLHLSGHEGSGRFLLANPDGSADPVSAAELVELLHPARDRLKLTVVSSGQPTAAATAQTLRALGLADPAIDLEAQAMLDAAASPMALARALVAHLDCAVVAMRYPAGDGFTIAFAEALYNRILRSTQPLDRAVAAAVADAAGPAPTSARPAISVATPAIFGSTAIGLALAPPPGRPALDPGAEAMARFPPEPPRFVGRAEPMAAASTALAPASGRTAVVFHGMAGAGKTTCAVELAYRHQRGFEGLAFWSAPAEADQSGDALRLLAVALEAQLGGYGVAMVDRIATLERLENFLPTLTAVLADRQLLLVLDNLDTLLTPDGQWRDLRWAPLISALTGHSGPSRVILSSRIVPAGLNSDRVLIRPLHALSRDASLLLTRELPNLHALLHTGADPGPARAGIPDPALGRRVLTLAQGHPVLLELADAAAADPARLAFPLADIEAAVDGMALSAFLAEGDTSLDAEQLLKVFTAWITHVAATLPSPARLLLQALCRVEESDRNTAALSANWAALWRRVDQSGEPSPLTSSVAPLVTSALVTSALVTAPPVATDPGDGPDGPVHYRIHPAVAEAVRATTPEAVGVEVDTQLATWWTVVGDWGIEQERAGKGNHQLALRAGLSAARYLLRQHHWHAAGCLLESVLIRVGYSPVTALAVIPLLRRIAEATGSLEHLVLLGAALRKVDPGEAETLLRSAYEQAITDGAYQIASTTAGDLVTLLRDQGRLREALRLVHQKIEHTREAGFGCWTQLSDQGRHLQILSLLGHHEQILTELPALRARMADLPDQRADNDRVNPWNVREGILDLGRGSAVALRRWTDALEFNDEIVAVKRRRGAGRYEVARARFNDHIPLLDLGRTAEVDRLLDNCQDAFDAAGDTTQLALVHGARADLAGRREQPQDAADLQRTSLRLWYVRPDPREISTAHQQLAGYLSEACGDPAEQRAHRLAAALLHHLTGDTRALTRTLGVLAGELGTGTGTGTGSGSAEAQALPTVLPTTPAEVTSLVDAREGIRFGELVVALCPDPATAEHALADLLASAATSAGPQPATALDTDFLVAAWAPIITAIHAATANNDTPAELHALLDDIATTDWPALVDALRRVLAGDRGHELLRAGLDDVGAAILNATFDRISTRQESR